MVWLGVRFAHPNQCASKKVLLFCFCCVSQERVLSLAPSGRALVFSASRGLEEVEMKSDSVAEFFTNHSNTIPKEKITALRLIAPEKIYMKGSPEYRLLTSSMSQLGRAIAEYCKDRGIKNPQVQYPVDSLRVGNSKSAFVCWFIGRPPR